MNEKKLVQRAQRGDADAFEELVNEHAVYVYNLALRVLGQPQEAEEAAQETFLRVWRSLEGFRHRSKFRTWLYTIVTRICFDRLPGLKQDLAAIDPQDVNLPDERKTPEDSVISSEMKRQVMGEVEALPAHYRLLITLRHLQEMSYAEIADVTGQPLGTVKTGIHRARCILAERMKEYER